MKKTLPYPGFKPGTFGFQVGNATNWAIEVGVLCIIYGLVNVSTKNKLWSYFSAILGSKLDENCLLDTFPKMSPFISYAIFFESL
jgi:hypothetical protein